MANQRNNNINATVSKSLELFWNHAECNES